MRPYRRRKASARYTPSTSHTSLRSVQASQRIIYETEVEALCQNNGGVSRRDTMGDNKRLKETNSFRLNMHPTNTSFSPMFPRQQSKNGAKQNHSSADNLFAFSTQRHAPHHQNLVEEPGHLLPAASFLLQLPTGRFFVQPGVGAYVASLHFTDPSWFSLLSHSNLLHLQVLLSFHQTAAVIPSLCLVPQSLRQKLSESLHSLHEELMICTCNACATPFQLQTSPVREEPPDS